MEEISDKSIYVQLQNALVRIRSNERIETHNIVCIVSYRLFQFLQSIDALLYNQDDAVFFNGVPVRVMSGDDLAFSFAKLTHIEA